MSANLNFSDELKTLMTLIQATWIGVDTPDVKAALVDAFNAGLRDGRFWVNKYINYRVGRAINQDTTDICPLYQRREDVNFLYDALCIFASNINDALSKIEHTQIRTAKWNYCLQMESVMSTLRQKYDLKGISPLEMPEAQQKHLISTYAGYDAEGARTRPTPEKLSYADALCSKQQGMSFEENLFSAVYSHGLACAQEYNDRSLVSVLTPIYQKYRDSPFSIVNGESFIESARQCEFFELLEAVSPFEFETESRYASEVARRAAYEAKLDAMSEEARTQYEQKRGEKLFRMMEEMLAEIREEDSGDELIARDALVESFRDRLSPFAVSAI
jgi:hypothetical protein